MSVGILLMEKTLGDLPQAQQELWLNFLRNSGKFGFELDSSLNQLKTDLVDKLVSGSDTLIDFAMLTQSYQRGNTYSLEKSLELVSDMLKQKQEKYGHDELTIIYTTIRDVIESEVTPDAWRELISEKELDFALNGRLRFIESIDILAMDSAIELGLIELIDISIHGLVLRVRVKVNSLEAVSPEFIYYMQSNVLSLRGNKHKIKRKEFRDLLIQLAESAPNPIGKAKLAKIMGDKELTGDEINEIVKHFRRQYGLTKDELIQENNSLAIKIASKVVR